MSEIESSSGDRIDELMKQGDLNRLEIKKLLRCDGEMGHHVCVFIKKLGIDLCTVLQQSDFKLRSGDIRAVGEFLKKSRKWKDNVRILLQAIGYTRVQEVLSDPVDGIEDAFQRKVALGPNSATGSQSRANISRQVKRQDVQRAYEKSRSSSRRGPSQLTGTMSSTFTRTTSGSRSATRNGHRLTIMTHQGAVPSGERISNAESDRGERFSSHIIYTSEPGQQEDGMNRGGDSDSIENAGDNRTRY